LWIEKALLRNELWQIMGMGKEREGKKKEVFEAIEEERGV